MLFAELVIGESTGPAPTKGTEKAFAETTYKLSCIAWKKEIARNMINVMVGANDIAYLPFFGYLISPFYRGSRHHRAINHYYPF